MKLYDYYRSTACYRVRIALNLKNINYEKILVHLINNGGEQHQSEYRALNPQGLIPTLDENGHCLTQSLAIIEYLDEINPNPPLLPQTPLGRAHVRSLAMTIACDTHPLNNLRVLQRLNHQFSADENQVNLWYHHWLQLCFDTLETRLQQYNRHDFCYGNTITLADICLILQIYNAHRFNFSMDNYPILNTINTHCLNLTIFKSASPEMQ